MMAVFIFVQFEIRQLDILRFSAVPAQNAGGLIYLSGFAQNCSRSSVDLRKLSSSSAPSRPERASCSSVSSEDSSKSRGVDRFRMRRSSTLLDSFKIPEEIKMAELGDLSSKRKKMMQRSAAIDNQQDSLEENAKVLPKASKQEIKSNVKEKIRRFQEKSLSLDLDTGVPEDQKSNAKLFNKDRYNRVRQKFLQKSSSVDLDGGWDDNDMMIHESSKLNQWLSSKSVEQNLKEEKVSFTQAVDRKKKKLLRSSSVKEMKTLLPLSAFQSFDYLSSVGSIEEEIHKLTIEAEIHGDNVESDRASVSEASEASSELLLEAKLIRTEGKLVKLASIDELIEYEQGEKVGKLNQ